jgi:hypothetical protein
LLAHELTHVAQQARSGPRVALQAASSFAPFESEGSRRAREFSRLTISILANALLATLRRDGANAFLRKLQKQSSQDRDLLRDESTFLAEVRRRLHGYDLWNAETMLGVDAQQKQSLVQGGAGLVNPFLSPEEQQEEVRASIRAGDFRRLTLSIVRDQLLEAIRQRNAIRFLDRLRGLDAADRRLLDQDSTFIAEMRRHFRGASLFSIRRILRWGPRFNDVPLPVRELGWAVRDRDTTRVRDLLRAFPQLRSEALTPGVRELLEYEFRRSPELREMRRILAEGVVAQGAVAELTRSAHWDRVRPTDPLTIRAYGITRRFSLVRTASEIRVVIRIRFVHATVHGHRTFHLSDAKRNEWRGQIEAAWNGRFAAVSGGTRLAFVFVPVFTESAPDFTVGVVDREEYFRENVTAWWLHSAPSHEQAAHEFGHMFGAPDEYNLPGSTAEIPAALGLSAAERRRSSVQGVTGVARPRRVGGYDLPGIMGSQDAEGAAGRSRHLWLVIQQVNTRLRRAGEAPFRVVP